MYSDGTSFLHLTIPLPSPRFKPRRSPVQITIGTVSAHLLSHQQLLNEDRTRNATAASHELYGTNPILRKRRAPLYETFVSTPALGLKVSPTQHVKALGLKSWATFLAPMPKIRIHSHVSAPDTLNFTTWYRTECDNCRLVSSWTRPRWTIFFMNPVTVIARLRTTSKHPPRHASKA